MSFTLHARLRLRLLPAGFALLALALGLASRAVLTGAAAKYLGVALWATLVYFLILTLAPRLTVIRAAIITLIIAWSVEFAQLTPLPAFLSSKHTLLRLIFGTTFHPPDLAALTAGVALAATIHAITAARPRVSSRPG